MPTAVPTRPTAPARPVRRTRRIAAIALTGALMGGAAALPQGAGAIPPGGVKDQSQGAKVSIGASKVKAGGRLKVSGTNWKAKGSRVQDGAKVTIKLDDSTIIGILPIKGKKFSGSVTIPKQVKAGKHWLRFLASEPSTSIRSRTFTVTK